MHPVQLQAMYPSANVTRVTLGMHSLHVKESQPYRQEYLQKEETPANHHLVAQMLFVLREILRQHVLASKIILVTHMLHVAQSVPSMQTVRQIRPARGTNVWTPVPACAVSMLNAKL